MPQILKEEIKNRIYKAASKIFYEKGFLKTKMKDISEEAKIPVGLVYTYYKNKRRIIWWNCKSNLLLFEFSNRKGRKRRRFCIGKI